MWLANHFRIPSTAIEFVLSGERHIARKDVPVRRLSHAQPLGHFGFTFEPAPRAQSCSDCFASCGSLRQGLPRTGVQSTGWAQSPLCHFCHLLMLGESSGSSVCHICIDTKVFFCSFSILPFCSLSVFSTADSLAPALPLSGEESLSCLKLKFFL